MTSQNSEITDGPQDNDESPTKRGKKRIVAGLLLGIVFLCVVCGVVAMLTDDREEAEVAVLTEETVTPGPATATPEAEPEPTETMELEPTDTPEATSTPTPTATPVPTPTPEPTPETVHITEPIVDIPALLGKDAFAIRDTLTDSLGEPTTDVAPTQERFGTLAWIISDQNVIFGFDYLFDGSIEEALIITGFREFGHSTSDILLAGNLDPDSPQYDLLINPLGTENAIDIWVLTDTPSETTDDPIASFGDGTWQVGIDIEAGTYRTDGTDSCYWERVSDFTGAFGAIIANDNPRGPAVVTILEADAGFTSKRCGTWALSETVKPGVPATSIEDGTWRVGIDIEAGTYRTDGTDSCYWERVSDFTGDFRALIANENPRGPALVTILASDAGFTSKRCGTWELQ